jgi:hypothetical protein
MRAVRLTPSPADLLPSFDGRCLRGLPVLVREVSRRAWGLRLRRPDRNLPSCRQIGEGVGSLHLAKGCLVRGQKLLRESGLRANCPARPAPDLCEAVPRPRW